MEARNIYVAPPRANRWLRHARYCMHKRKHTRTRTITHKHTTYMHTAANAHLICVGAADGGVTRRYEFRLRQPAQSLHTHNIVCLSNTQAHMHNQTHKNTPHIYTPDLRECRWWWSNTARWVPTAPASGELDRTSPCFRTPITKHHLIGVQQLYPLLRLSHEKVTTHFTPF